MNNRLISRTYRGYTITPSDYNSSGIRWLSMGRNGLKLRSDTLSGIKMLIMHDIKDGSKNARA